MKHYFFCSLFFLLIFSELCYGLKTPKIIFDKKVCDFGIVKYKANSIIKIKFYYKKLRKTVPYGNPGLAKAHLLYQLIKNNGIVGVQPDTSM